MPAFPILYGLLRTFLQFDKRSEGVSRMKEEDRFSMCTCLGFPIAEDAQPRRAQAVGSGLEVGHFKANMVDGAGGISCQKLRDR